jgi:SAM-dependent methyltransferase
MGYSRSFFEDQQSGSLESARRIVPILRQLVSPRSVLDVGCGTGTWLSVWREQGVEDVIGCDGAYVPQDMLLFPRDRFRSAELTDPPAFDRPFDLAMSLEVGEHLPEASSRALVGALAGAAPVVAFSAAIPLQGGTHHVNERPQSFWAGLFHERGFLAVDAVRPLVWSDGGVALWYAQNLLIYAKESEIARRPALAEARARTDERLLDVVHPRLLAMRNATPILPLSQLIRWTGMVAYSRTRRLLKRGR